MYLAPKMFKFDGPLKRDIITIMKVPLVLQLLIQYKLNQISKGE